LCVHTLKSGRKKSGGVLVRKCKGAAEKSSFSFKGRERLVGGRAYCRMVLDYEKFIKSFLRAFPLDLLWKFVMSEKRRVSFKIRAAYNKCFGKSPLQYRWLIEVFTKKEGTGWKRSGIMCRGARLSRQSRMKEVSTNGTLIKKKKKKPTQPKKKKNRQHTPKKNTTQKKTNHKKNPPPQQNNIVSVRCHPMDSREGIGGF